MLIEAVALKAAHTQRVRHQVAMSSRERLMAGYERKKRSFAAHAQRAGTQREAQRAASHITRQRHTRIKCEVQIRSWRNVPHFGQRAIHESKELAISKATGGNESSFGRTY